jgi:hypothetical protein
MGDAGAKRAARREYAADLRDRVGHLVDVHERVVGDDQFEARRVERQGLGPSEDVLAGGIRRAGGAEQRLRRVEANDVVALPA